MRLRAWLASGAVVAAGLLAAQPATAATAVPFHADSGDQCLRGVAEGTLEWVDGPILRPVVQVDGALTDEASISPCAHDGLYSTVTFSGYSGKSLVDSEVAKADNEKVALSFTLSNPDAFIPVDRVVVQVCRYSTTPVGTSYCGKAVEYTAS